MFIAFRSTLTCEPHFPLIKYQKNKNALQLTDVHLITALNIYKSNLSSINRLMLFNFKNLYNFYFVFSFK